MWYFEIHCLLLQYQRLPLLNQIILVRFNIFLEIHRKSLILYFSTDNQQSSVLYSYNRELLTKANYPVYLTQQTFFQMLFTSDEHHWSKLESFLASSVLVRQFAKGVTEPADVNNPTVRIDYCKIFLSSKSNFRFVLYQMNKIHID